MERFRVLSNNPQSWLLDKGLSADRLDATFYEPRFLNDSQELDVSGIPTFRIGKKASKANCGATPQLVKYGDSGSILVRGANIRPNHFDESTAERVPGLDVDPDGNRAILPGDLLYTMSGVNVGNAAVYPQGQGVASFSNTVARARFSASSDIDPYFASLFLNSRLGMSQTNRLISGGVLPHVMPNAFKKLRLIVPSLALQSAIGNKYRKAERLSLFARHLWARAAHDLAGLLGLRPSLDEFSELTTRDLQSSGYQCQSILPAVAFASVHNELGAQYFHPRRVHARLAASRTGRTNTLCDVASRINRGSPTDGGFVGLDAIDSSTGVIDGASIGGNGVETGCSRFSPKDILFSRLRPYLNKVAIWPEHRGSGRGSGELLVYRSESIDPYFLFFIIKSALGLHQVIDVTAGSTHPRVDAEVVDQMLIPRVDEADEKLIGSMVSRAHSYWYECQELMPEAEKDVEALVVGTLDEPQMLKRGEEIAVWLESNPIPAQIGIE